MMVEKTIHYWCCHVGQQLQMQEGGIKYTVSLKRSTTKASNEVIFIGFIPEFGFDFLEN